MANASDSPHFPPKLSQQIKILTDEDCISAADHGGEESSPVYYGGATGAVPFMWESQPGTPKHKSSYTPLRPPLTPPPSHQFISTSPRTNSSHKKNSKNSNLSNLNLSRIPSKKVNRSPSLSFSSSSSSSCSHLVCSANSPNSTAGNELHDIGYDSRKISPSSTTCFGPHKKRE